MFSPPDDGHDEPRCNIEVKVRQTALSSSTSSLTRLSMCSRQAGEAASGRGDACFWFLLFGESSFIARYSVTMATGMTTDVYPGRTAEPADVAFIVWTTKFIVW